MLNFIGIGAQKAGTTWIAHNLNKHPEINFPAGKEVHFWDQPENYNKGTQAYQSLFTGSDEIKNGDITPAYAFMDVDKIKELHCIYPDIRIIYCVRNPIDRAWSAARMMLKRAEMTMSEASDWWFMDHFKSQGSLLRGDYIKAVDNWLSVFPEEQLLLLDFEDIKNCPDRLIAKCCRHIDVDFRFFADGILSGRVHHGDDEPIRSTLTRHLHKTYDLKISAMREHPILSQVFKNDF